MTVEVRGMKTWSKLAENKRRPSEYEVVTTNLQTRTRYRDQAYELSPAPDLDMNAWCRPGRSPRTRSASTSSTRRCSTTTGRPFAIRIS